MSAAVQHIAGASIAVLAPRPGLSGYEMIAIQRDDKKGLPYRNFWEFPGGGIEPEETPVQCALRELWEECGVTVDESQVVWEAFYPRLQPAADGSTLYNAFYVANVPNSTRYKLQKGDEGRACAWLPASDFTGRQQESGVQAIPDHIDRYYDFIHGLNGTFLGGMAIRQYQSSQAA